MKMSRVTIHIKSRRASVLIMTIVLTGNARIVIGVFGSQWS